VVGELKQNSSNIVTLISQNYAVTPSHFSFDHYL
jgi:hypothetical protein